MVFAMGEKELISLVRDAPKVLEQVYTDLAQPSVRAVGQGFMYLTAIIDVYSRYIVGRSLHNTLDASNCTEVLKKAIVKYGAPEIINSDQGRQFASLEWKEALRRIS